MSPSPRRPARAVFFDAGGTLFREQPIRWEIYATVGREFGLPADPTTMRTAMTWAHEDLPIRLNGHFRYTDGWFQVFVASVFKAFGATDEQIPAITARLFETFRDRRSFVVFPETYEVVDAVRSRGLRTGIVSNWSPRLPAIVRDLGLEERMDFVLCSATEELEKPDPEIFERALERAGVEADEAIHVGDSVEKDVAGALASGILPVLLVRPGPHDLDGDTAFPGRLDDTTETAKVARIRVRDLRGLLPLLDGAS